MSQLSVDSITGRVAGSAPSLPNGVVVTGVVTATSFSGDGSQLSGIDAGALKEGSNVKVQAVSTGATVTGNLGVSGNLTVNGTTTTIDTIITEVDSLSVYGNISAGSSVTAASFYGDGSQLSWISVESWNQLDTWLFSP